MGQHGRGVSRRWRRVPRTPDVTTADACLRWNCLASGRLESPPSPRWTTARSQAPGRCPFAGEGHVASGSDQGAGPRFPPKAAEGRPPSSRRSPGGPYVTKALVIWRPRVKHRRGRKEVTVQTTEIWTYRNTFPAKQNLDGFDVDA